mmetsp:Transcript_50823/g.80543  ORF Transcript_50823/g.80543 Transcript_50823/m.80543 type:complete len:563 (-) Transcript_50823:160-1848(-)|eukprot:CAMPEP_0169084488 /NCGR_PEP_ID=MMETSP1015-20121227/12654_1 /TAXON_ID=342587 /ORGANISM="Karlodinium micrum, Strain CCMP2283" /LENGTH=562 /DNA_ID=CAMNT_0009144513 /DNA_START=65 /DNA_END=1753 /DNA_ORIENTATION=-
MTLASFLLVLLAWSTTRCVAHDFLKGGPKVLNERLSEDEIRTSIFEEVEGTFGAGSISNRLEQLEKSLKPMYTALPKNGHGRLAHSTVRYALHRLFVMRHGWDIRGLGGKRGVENTTSSAGVLKDKVPSYIQDLFEKRLGGKGLDLRDLAVFASAIEHLIHTEAVRKLGAAFNVHKFLPTESLTESSANDVLDTYMAAFILGENLTNATLKDARGFVKEIPDVFGHWSETKQFVSEIRKNTTRSSGKVGTTEPYLDFSVLAQVVEEVGEKFGTFQDIECQHLKKSLTNIEVPGTGRVKLADFYKPAVANPDEAWQFSESVAYLRQLGALDESDPNSPSVMIANYLHSSNNCIASSGFYSVCCKDECEALFGHLEERIGAPEAKPAAIMELVKKLASPSVPAPRDLPETLVSRLEGIAAMHGGMIHVHGRLFAQWMHHAYPRECPYPHLSGTITQQSPQEWEDSGSDIFASNEEMRQFTDIATQNVANDIDVNEAMIWTPEEELFVERPVWSPTDTNSRIAGMSPALRSMALLAAAASFSLVLFKSLKLSSELDNSANSKLFV